VLKQGEGESRREGGREEEKGEQERKEEREREGGERVQREDKEERREPQAFAIVLQCFGKAVSPPLPPPTTTIHLQRQP
jgi:hypothetical protein